MKHQEEGLRQQVQHLILDFRVDIVKQRLKDIQQQLRQAGNDMERIKQLLQEYKDAQLIRNVLAKQIGNDIVVN